GMYMAPLELRGKPRTPIAIPTIVTVIIQGIPVDFQRAAVYKYAKPDEGERYQPFEILPKVMINAKDNVMVFADQQPKPLSLSVTSATNGINGIISLETPDGWKVSPIEQSISIPNKGEVKTVTFDVVTPKGESQGSITPVVKVKAERYSKELNTINYEHIPTQSVLLDPSVKVVRSDIQIQGKKIAYVMGAGDAVPESLEQIGYQV